jgi:hypothetical protein
MIYVLSTNIVVPGKMAQYFEIAEKAQPMYPKLGMKIVGSWHGYTGNMNAIYVLYAYDDLAALQKAAEARRTNTEWRTIYAAVNSLITSQTGTILEPNPWSPLK